MPLEEKTTAIIPPVGADVEQSVSKNTSQRISDGSGEFNQNFHQESAVRQLSQGRSSGAMCTFSMHELYENVYESRPPLIDGLLYSGTYPMSFS